MSASRARCSAHGRLAKCDFGEDGLQQGSKDNNEVAVLYAIYNSYCIKNMLFYAIRIVN